MMEQPTRFKCNKCGEPILPGQKCQDIRDGEFAEDGEFYPDSAVYEHLGCEDNSNLVRIEEGESITCPFCKADITVIDTDPEMGEIFACTACSPTRMFYLVPIAHLVEVVNLE